MKEVKKALNMPNVTEWYQEQNKQSKGNTNETKHREKIQLEDWKEEHIQKWLKEERMEELTIPLTNKIRSGRKLKELNKEKIEKEEWNDEIKRLRIHDYNRIHRNNH